MLGLMVTLRSFDVLTSVMRSIYKNTLTYLFSTLMLILCSHLSAQDFTAGDVITLQVWNYCLIETNHAPIALNLNGSGSVPGAPLSAVSNSDMYLKLSSIVPWILSRKVTVRISSGSVPAGTSLSVVAAPCTITNSGGDLGNIIETPTIMSSTDQPIIVGIGSCYTGTGYNDGYRLTYTWLPSSNRTDYGLINATESPVNITIVYTISNLAF
jgi:hypothetical protein